ncbi:hypothetical protein M5689_023202 [Euphorbia peplus]|nr:hypothetical protein M5689_023202 [Euphorbia peplus]
MAHLIPAHFTGKSQPSGGYRGGGAAGAGIILSTISFLSIENLFLVAVSGNNVPPLFCIITTFLEISYLSSSSRFIIESTSLRILIYA